MWKVNAKSTCRDGLLSDRDITHQYPRLLTPHTRPNFLGILSLPRSPPSVIAAIIGNTAKIGKTPFVGAARSRIFESVLSENLTVGSYRLQILYALAPLPTGPAPAFLGLPPPSWATAFMYRESS